MTRSLIAAGLFAWSIASLGTVPADQTVVVHGWAEDVDSGRPLSSLSAQDLELSVDGAAASLQSVTPSQRPASIILLIDASRTMQWTPRPLDQHVAHFTSALPPHDRVMLATFGAGWSFPSFQPAAQDLRKEVRRALDIDADEGYGNSPVWDAIAEAVTLLTREPGPRQIVLLTDGRATGNRYGLAQVADYAMANRVSVTVLLKPSAEKIRQNESIAAVVRPGGPLQGLSTYTGGMLLAYPSERGAPRQVFSTLADASKALHAITFTAPVGDGGPHRLEIRSKRAHTRIHAPLAFVKP